jgi:glycopeptide antibiotics resistance protein
MIPLIIYLSNLFGGMAYHSQSVDIAYSSALSLESISVNLVQYIIGSIIFAAVLSLGGGLITFILLKIFRKKRTAVAIAENQPDQP